MSFDKTAYAPVSVGYSTVAPSIRGSYKSATDTLATILGSAYFNTIADILTANDLIYVQGSDETQLIQVTAVSPNVTTSLYTGVTRYAEVAISSADVLAMRATPKTLIAAPGVGRVLQFISGILILDWNSIAYVESTANFGVKFTNGSGVQVSQTIENTGFIDQTADTATSALAKIDAIVAKTGCENQALVLHNLGAGEITTGNSALRMKIAYQIHYTGW